MSIFRKRNREEDPSPLAGLAEQMNVGARPPVSPPVDSGLVLDSATQQAIADAATGAYDTPGIEAMDNQFPYEDRIDRALDLQKQNAEQQLVDSDVLDHRIIADVRNGARPADSLRYFKKQHDDLKADLKRAKEQLASAIAVLDGHQVASDGTPWTGKHPNPPTGSNPVAIRFRPERLILWFVAIGMTLLLSGFEQWIVSDTLRQDLRTDAVLAGLIYAVPAVLAATAIPHVIGIRLAGLVRRRRISGADWIALAAVPFWLGAVLFLARMRTDTAQQVTVTRIAAMREVSASSIDPNEVFSYGWAFGRWALILASIGAAIIVVKAAFHNPAFSEALHAETRIALLKPKLADAADAVKRRRDDVAVQKQARHSNKDAFRQHIDHTLPALARTAKAEYVHALINAAGDPSFTGAVVSAPAHAHRRNGIPDTPGGRGRPTDGGRSLFDVLPVPNGRPHTFGSQR